MGRRVSTRSYFLFLMRQNLPLHHLYQQAITEASRPRRPVASSDLLEVGPFLSTRVTQPLTTKNLQYVLQPREYIYAPIRYS